jgi:hypothetical protein
VTTRPELGNDFAAHDLVAAEMGEGRIAAEHPSGIGVEHATAGAIVDVVFDLVQTLHRAPQFCSAVNLAGLPVAVTINLRASDEMPDTVVEPALFGNSPHPEEPRSGVSKDGHGPHGSRRAKTRSSP